MYFETLTREEITFVRSFSFLDVVDATGQYRLTAFQYNHLLTYRRRITVDALPQGTGMTTTNGALPLLTPIHTGMIPPFPGTYTYPADFNSADFLSWLLSHR